MASINGVNSSNKTSSLYNTGKTISGLASGLDTEGMIEGLVQGYQSKITALSQKATKVQWKQDAYRDIISRMSKFTEKYTSYTSGTNLMSSAFFDSAIKVAAQGANADKVTAGGKTSSTVVLNKVDSLATAAQYVTDSRLNVGDGKTITGAALDFNSDVTLGALQGSLSLTYGSQVINLSFSEMTDKFDGPGSTAADKLAKVIENKLKEQKITLKSGESVAASDRIGVSVEGGKITFTDKSSAGNSVYLSGASGNVAEKLGLDLSNASETKPSTIGLADGVKLSRDPIQAGEYLAGKSITLTLDQVTKTIQLPAADGDVVKYASDLKTAIDGAFGAGKIDVGTENSGLKFTVVKGGSELLINSDVGEVLGIGKTAGNTFNTDKTLGELMGSGIDATKQDFILNGKVVGQFNKDSKLSEVMSAINSDPDAGVKVSYSKTTREFVFTAKETGAQGKVEFGAGLASDMFGAGFKIGSTTQNAKITKQDGQDAKFTVTVNGTETSMERSTNSVDIDGLTLNFKESFTTGGAVSFQSAADADKVVNAVKDMIKDYNEMMVEVKKSFSTLPAQKSTGSYYEPLTESDRSDMSESAIAQYEEKAKQGLLFGDNVLSGLYDQLRSVFSPTGEDGAMLRKMGITSSYSADGGAGVVLDESKLRAMLESDPDAVSAAFTKSVESGAKSNGVMQKVKVQMDNYSRTSGSTKGILVERAGSPLSPLSLLKNTFQDQIDEFNKQISNWEDKLATKVDSYTKQFSRLETLINQMNSQSSMLSGLTG